jgi:hypothetical protein
LFSIKGKKRFEDHLSVRNSKRNPEAGLGVFAERKFYKGSVISLYVGQPVWIAPIEGGNLPMDKHVRQEILKAKAPWHSSDCTIALRDLQGRYYAVNPQPFVRREDAVHCRSKQGRDNSSGRRVEGARKIYPFSVRIAFKSWGSTVFADRTNIQPALASLTPYCWRTGLLSPV